MNRPIRIAHFGVGRMGSMIVRYALEKGGVLAAAFDSNPALTGKDAGQAAGLAPLGVPIQSLDRAEETLAACRPDICTISTQGTLAELRPLLTLCVRAGCSCLTIGEEAAWPWTAAPEEARELDLLARQHGVTISASGYPDVYWQNLVLTVAGSHHRLTRIQGTVTYNVEQYGPHFITGHGVGLEVEEFRARFAGEAAPQGYGAACMPGDPNGWLCHALGLTVTRQTMENVPRLSDRPVWCESYQRDIAPGQVLGTANVVTTETVEGVEIAMEVCGKVYAPGEQDALTWTFSGEPDTTLVIPRPNTPVLTAASPVNRIPQVIDAPPGYVTTEALPVAPYLVRPMHEYVRSV